jgi:hypothetical protein
MKTKLLVASVAIAALAFGAANARTHHRHMAGAKASTYAAPAQPIAYSQLGAYLKASPRQRASMDFTSGGASTGAAANTAATPPATTDTTAAPAAPAAPAAEAPPAATPPAATPPADTTAPATPATPATPPANPPQ